MILGIILNNFKCYKGLHYIPLTNAERTNYCGLIGLNGVGKSAIMEALDCVFNGKTLIKTINNDNNNSYIIPIMVENETFLDGRIFTSDGSGPNRSKRFGFWESESFKEFLENEIPTSVSKEHFKIWNQLKEHYIQIPLKDKLVFPLFQEHIANTTISIFDELLKLKLLEGNYKTVIDYFIKVALSYRYVYVSQNIAYDSFSIFETEQLQRLLNIKLYLIMDKLNGFNITQFNRQFRDNITQLSEKLDEYAIVQNPEDKYDFNIRTLFSYISHNIFPKCQLEKKTIIGNIPLTLLSSGEKQKAIMDILYHSVKNQINDRLIIAIDEPESSFHLSERFEQFNKLYEISKNCNHVLFSSHWYGFIPSIPDGCVVNIVENVGKRSESVLDIYKYKEEAVRLPVDISLKGNSELIQTILSSILIDNCYNWLICEGTSDKIYLEEYLKYEITDKKLRIIPIGGCSHIKKIYSYLALSLLDLKIEDIKGQIFLLVDTDEDKVDEYKNPELPKDIKTYHTHNVIQFKRLVNIKKTRKTILSEFGANTKTATDMEGVLNGKAFYKVIINNFKTELPFVTEDEKNEIPSAFALDLKDSEKDTLKAFFTQQNKVRFARAYVEELQKGNYKVPDWITEIKKFFNS